MQNTAHMKTFKYCIYTSSNVWTFRFLILFFPSINLLKFRTEFGKTVSVTTKPVWSDYVHMIYLKDETNVCALFPSTIKNIIWKQIKTKSKRKKNSGAMSFPQMCPCFFKSKNKTGRKKEADGTWEFTITTFYSNATPGWSADHILTPKRSGLLGNLPWGSREGSHSPCLEMFSREELAAASLSLSGSAPPPGGRVSSSPRRS